nr:MAG TPA: hypothetical protein [Caudoviricetes sp.]
MGYHYNYFAQVFSFFIIIFCKGVYFISLYITIKILGIV